MRISAPAMFTTDDLRASALVNSITSDNPCAACSF